MSNASLVEVEKLGHDLTWDTIGGIALGWVMFLVLEPLVMWVNFAPWIVNPARRPRPTPEKYLHACVHSFVAMVFTGAVLFQGFSEQRHHKESTALVQWFGYNNVCIVFDSPPSTYVCPIFWFAVGYLAVRFAYEDTAQRIAPMTHVSETHKKFAKFANGLFALVAAFFSLCLAIRPEDDMITHSGPFVALVLGFALLYVLHYFQFQGERPKDYTAMVVIYTVLSLIKASFTVVALATNGSLSAPTVLAQRVDGLWVALALFAPFFFHPPSATKEIYSQELFASTEAYRTSRLKDYIVVQPKTHVRRDIKHDPNVEYVMFLKKGDRIQAEEKIGNEIRFGGTVSTGFKGGWVTIKKRDGTPQLQSTTTYRCVMDIAIFEDHDSNSKKVGRLYPGELVEAEKTTKNKARGTLQAEFVKIRRGWVPLCDINGMDAVQPARSYKCLRETAIRASSKKHSATIGYLKPGEIINAMEVRTSSGGKTKVKFQDSLHGLGWVFQSVPGSSSPVLEETNARVPTKSSRALARKICDLQEQYDERAGESWRLETAKLVNDVHAGSRRWGAVSAPLGLLFFLWLIVGVILHLVGVFFKRYVLNRIARSQVFQSVAKLNTFIPNLSTIDGDIIGYAKYTRGWNNFLLAAQQQHNETVFAENIGCPALMALDVKSATKLIFEGSTVAREAHGMNMRFLPSLFGGQRPNFTRSGDVAQISRKFLLKMMPKDESDPRFVAAVKALGTELRRWTRMDPADLQDVEAVEAIGEAILKFVSHLLLGATLDSELVKYIFPLPGCFPTYPSFIPFLPSWFPTRLLPSWYQAKYVSDKLFENMKTSPNWTAYTVKTKTVPVYVGPLCTEKRYISKDKDANDKSQEVVDVVLAQGDRVVMEDIVDRKGRSLRNGQKPFAIRFSQGWIDSRDDGTGVELQKVPLLEGWVKCEDLEEPLIPRILREMRGDEKDPKEWNHEHRMAQEHLTDEAAFGNLLVAATFNAAGLSNSLMMPFFVLPELLRSNPSLGEDEQLLDSIAWECLRHNGPGLKKKLQKTVARVSTSKGCPLEPVGDVADESLLSTEDHKEYTVPAGTTVFTHLGMLQRDSTYWEKPHTFMADRFMSYNRDEEDPHVLQTSKQGRTFKSADEPYPTLGFGYPLQGQQRLSYEDDVVKDSHGCVFGPLMQPFVKEYVKRIVNDFQFALEKTADLELSRAKSGRSVDFATVEGFGPSNIKGGMKATEDMLPKVDGGIRFAVFQFRDEVIEEEMFDPQLNIKYTGLKYDGAGEPKITIDRAPGMVFTKKDIGSNISEMKYAMEFNQVYPAFEFDTVKAKAKFADEYKKEFPSHRVVPDGMDLEPPHPTDTNEPGLRMGDNKMHVAKVLLHREGNSKRNLDDLTAVQAKVMLNYWDLLGEAAVEAKKWNEWDWDPWELMKRKHNYEDTREHKRKGFRQELEDRGLLNRAELVVTREMVTRDTAYYHGLVSDDPDNGLSRGDGIRSLRKDLTDTMIELRMQLYMEKTGKVDRDSAKGKELKKDVEVLREKLGKLEIRYMGFKAADIGKTIMEVAGAGWCASRRASDDDSEENSSMVHWDLLNPEISDELGDKIRQVAMTVRELSDYPQKAKAEMKELVAIKYLYETLDADDDGVVEKHEVAESHDAHREIRKLRSFGAWTMRCIRSKGRDPTLLEIKRSLHKAKAEDRGTMNAFSKADKDGDGVLTGDEREAYYSDLANQKRMARIMSQSSTAAGRRVKLIRPPPHPPHHSLGRSKKYSDAKFKSELHRLMGGKGEELRLGNFNRDEEAEYYFTHPDEAPEGWDELMEAYYCEHPVVSSQPSMADSRNSETSMADSRSSETTASTVMNPVGLDRLSCSGTCNQPSPCLHQLPIENVAVELEIVMM